MTGGSGRQYQTVAMYLYEKAFGGTQFKFGYAAAIAWCLFLLIAVISLVNFLLVRRIRSARLMTAIPYRARAATRRVRRAPRLPPRRRLTYVFLLLLWRLSLFPLYWSFVVASHDNSALARLPAGADTREATFHNIGRLFNSGEVNVDFWTALINSAIVAGVVTASVVFFSALAGFAFAKLSFRGSKLLIVVVIATLIVPVQLGVIPLYIEMNHFGWLNHLQAVIAPFLVTAFGVFLMRQYIVQRRSERADRRGARRRVPHPAGLLARRPAGRAPDRGRARAAHVHEHLERLLLAADRAHSQQPDRAGRGLDTRGAAYVQDYSLVLTGTFVSILPLLVVFLVLGRQIIGGIMKGAVKG